MDLLYLNTKHAHLNQMLSRPGPALKRQLCFRSRTEIFEPFLEEEEEEEGEAVASSRLKKKKKSWRFKKPLD